MGPDNSLSIANTFSVTLDDIRRGVAAHTPFVITDEDELERAKKNKVSLMRMRTGITSAGKQGREASNAYNKAVLAIEKEMLAEITPVEELFALEISEYEHKQAIAFEAAKLPDRKAACARYHIDPLPDQELMIMTDDGFHSYVIEEQAKRLNTFEGTPTVTAETAPLTKDGPQLEERKDGTIVPVESRGYRDWLKDNDYNPTTHFISKEASQCILWGKVSIFNF